MAEVFSVQNKVVFISGSTAGIGLQIAITVM